MLPILKGVFGYLQPKKCSFFLTIGHLCWRALSQLCVLLASLPFDVVFLLSGWIFNNFLSPRASFVIAFWIVAHPLHPKFGDLLSLWRVGCSRASGQLRQMPNHPFPLALIWGQPEAADQRIWELWGWNARQGAQKCIGGAKIKSILNSVLYLTGSQCSKASTGEMLSLFLVLVSSWAATFCTSCRRDRADLLTPT